MTAPINANNPELITNRSAPPVLALPAAVAVVDEALVVPTPLRALVLPAGVAVVDGYGGGNKVTDDAGTERSRRGTYSGKAVELR